MFNGLYDMMDGAMAEALGVDLEIYIDIIDNKCTFEEADFIISAVWGKPLFANMRWSARAAKCLIAAASGQGACGQAAALRSGDRRLSRLITTLLTVIGNCTGTPRRRSLLLRTT